MLDRQPDPFPDVGGRYEGGVVAPVSDQNPAAPADSVGQLREPASRPIDESHPERHQRETPLQTGLRQQPTGEDAEVGIPARRGGRRGRFIEPSVPGGGIVLEAAQRHETAQSRRLGADLGQ
jgi:hypothetical protein